jgi:hypothetical protein
MNLKIEPLIINRSRIEPLNRSQIHRRAIAETRKQLLPLPGGEGRGEGKR